MAFNFVLPCEMDISGTEANEFPYQITKIKPNSVSVSVQTPSNITDYKGFFNFQQMAFSKASDDTKLFAIYDDTSISYYDQTTTILKASLNGSNLNFFEDVSSVAVLRSSYYNEGIDLYDTATELVVSSLKNEGLSAKVYSTVEATLDATCSLSLLQGITSGFYSPIFDSGLTYNPSTNLLSVKSLALSTDTLTPTFAMGTLTVDCAFATSREYTYSMTANINSLVLTNRRTNGVYKITLTNSSATTRTVSTTLGGTNKSQNYNPSGNVAVGEFFIMTVQVLAAAGTDYNWVSMVKFT